MQKLFKPADFNKDGWIIDEIYNGWKFLCYENFYYKSLKELSGEIGLSINTIRRIIANQPVTAKSLYLMSNWAHTKKKNNDIQWEQFKASLK